MAADHADIRVPPECREMIRAGALLAISTSGGKDSQAMTILLSRIVPRDQLVAVHAPLGKVEWEGTIQLIEATLPQGVPLIFAPVTSGKSLLDRVEERGKFPGIHQRWCTASHKRDPIERELRHFMKTHPRFGGRLVNCLGIRRDESAARARRVAGRRRRAHLRAQHPGHRAVHRHAIGTAICGGGIQRWGCLVTLARVQRHRPWRQYRAKKAAEESQPGLLPEAFPVCAVGEPYCPHF